MIHIPRGGTTEPRTASGEHQRHRNLLETVEVRGFVEVSPESNGNSLNPVERNLAVVSGKGDRAEAEEMVELESHRGRGLVMLMN